jgi:hypothetical protein
MSTLRSNWTTHPTPDGILLVPQVATTARASFGSTAWQALASRPQRSQQAGQAGLGTQAWANGYSTFPIKNPNV